MTGLARDAWIASLLLLVQSGALGCEKNHGEIVIPSASVIPVVTSEPPADPGVFVSKRFGVRLRLPRAQGWKIDDSTGNWLVASQRDEGSTLLVRVWNSENRMSRDKCEAQAREFRSLPSREGAELVDQRRIDVPGGFDTHVDVGLVAKEGGELFGFALAFGGWKRRCFAYVYATRAVGPSADALVGDRLAEIVEGSLLPLRLDSDLETTLERDLPAQPQR